MAEEEAPPTARTVLIVEDSETMRVYLERPLVQAGYQVLTAASFEEGQRAIETEPLDLVLLDLGLGSRDGRELLAMLREVSPDVPVIVVTNDNTATSAVELMRHGAFEYLVKPVEIPQLLRLVGLGVELCAARRALAQLRDARRRETPEWYIGETPRMAMLDRLVTRLAPTQAAVLIEGESGTGKEVVARALHSRSPRADGPFVAINCAALPSPLLESQLFGHERGAFTGAISTQKGLFEQANGGTLFLDEVTMMSPEMQAKLLRALQDQRIRRVGGQHEIRVNVRVVSASNRSVMDAIAAGEFREDLFFRICVMLIQLPPLRQRVVDIPVFAHQFLAATREEMACTVKGFSDAAIWALCRYNWPGNIRELKNVVERAAILANGEELIDVVHLPDIVRAVESKSSSAAGKANGSSHLPTILPAEGLDMKELEARWERSLIEQALARTQGNQSGAARLLGLTRDELRYRLEKYGISLGSSSSDRAEILGSGGERSEPGMADLGAVR